MLSIRDKDDTIRWLAHLREENISMLYSIQLRFDGELALWDCRNKCWVPISNLRFETAHEVVLTSVPAFHYEPKE